MNSIFIIITWKINHQIEVMSSETIPAEEVREFSLDLQDMLKTYTANVERTLKKRGFLPDTAS